MKIGIYFAVFFVLLTCVSAQVAIIPSEPTDDDDLFCKVSESSTYKYQWYKNGDIQNEFKSSRISHENTGLNEVWTCKMFVPPTKYTGLTQIGEATVTIKQNVPIIYGTINITYPSEYVVFQRITNETGEIIISGTYSGNPSGIEASFNNEPFVLINSSSDTFSGRFNATVGQGNLVIRFANNNAINKTISNVGIGDVFVIGGQSNAEGWAGYFATLDPSNNFNAIVYKQTDSWEIANDPTDNAGSAWPILANHIISSQNIPVAFITTADGGQPLWNWQKGFYMYDQMIEQVKEATNGTMRVKTMLFYQGENEAYGLEPTSPYDFYKLNLNKMADDFIADTEIAETVIVGQIDGPVGAPNRFYLDEIRMAQLDSWNEHSNISAGPTTYDITQSSVPHFATEEEMKELGRRWWASVADYIYGIARGRGPILINITTLEPSSSRIILNFDTSPLYIKRFDGISGTKAEGWRIIDGSNIYTDADIISTNIIGNQVEINLSVSISNNSRLWLGSEMDGHGKYIIVDGNSFGLPAETIFNATMITVGTSTTETGGSISLGYPDTLTMFQRITNETGEIIISGTYSGNPSSLEASFNGISFVPVLAELIDGNFRGKFNASVGQGNLIIRFANNNSITDEVANISVGDIYVIAGQSNAAGFGEFYGTLDSSNTFIATAFLKDDAWKIANDPVNAAGSPWPVLANLLIQRQNVPISFISTAEGGTPLYLWQKGEWCYDEMIEQIKEATNGTMRVKSMLFFQGERDACGDMTTSPYENYKSNLSRMADDFVSDTEIAETVIAGQINLPQCDAGRVYLDNVRKAQMDAWNDYDNVSAGPTTYDIETITGVHFSKENELKSLAERWYASVAKVIYGIGDGRGPQLTNIELKNSKSIVLSFDENLIVSDWNGTAGTNVEGFYVIDGSSVFNDSHVVSAKVIGNKIEVNFSSVISNNAKIYYGSYLDGFGKNVARDTSEFKLPVETIFNRSIDIVSAATWVVPETRISRIVVAEESNSKTIVEPKSTEKKTTTKVQKLESKTKEAPKTIKKIKVEQTTNNNIRIIEVKRNLLDRVLDFLFYWT